MPRFLFHLCWLLLVLVLPWRLTQNAMAESAPQPDLTQLLQPGKHALVIPVDGHNRKFVFVTPKGFKPGQPLPIVFFFHGAGGTARQASRTYGWTEKADAENFFAAFPEGLPVRPDSGGLFHIWRDGRGNHPSDVDDVHFFQVLLDQLEAAVPIDPHRIYVTGFSNGAGMTFTLGGHFSNRIAAIAPVSSQSFAHVDSLARPLPVYYLTGTADPLIPYNGGKSTLPTIGGREGYPPVQDSVDRWAKLDGCPTQSQVVSDADGVRVLRYGPGQGDSEVLFTTIEGNGHHWPGSVEPLPHAVVGPTLDPFVATDRIWDFFQQHPLPAGK